MTVVFRVDASVQSGTGHVMRCLALAQELRARNVPSRFICRETPGHVIAQLRERGYPVTTLADSAGDEDPDLAVQALHGNRPDWLVVDHYHLDVRWECRLRPWIGRLLVIDDLANRPHDCDLLLDQNYLSDGARRYAGLIPKWCELLLGPHYALLAPEFAAYRQAHPRRQRPVTRVLVYFGGTDASNMTGQTLAALSTPEFADLVIELVIGPNHPHGDALADKARARPGTNVHRTRPHLADLMAEADVAIGAGGVTTWERMCLGLPSLVVSIAENQRPTCEALAAAGLIEYVGDGQSVGAAEIRRAFSRLVADGGRLAALSARGQELVDGRGASSVADAMVRAGADEVIRRRNALHGAGTCPEGFESFAFAWIDRCRAEDVIALRNAPHVRAQMRSQSPIDAGQHQAFLEDYDRRDRYDFVLIDQRNDRYVGAFYVTNLGSVPEIGKYIGNADYLGRGIARKAMQSLLTFCRSHAGLRHLVSMTRHDNLRNIALNRKLGFQPSGTRGEYLVMTLAL